MFKRKHKGSRVEKSRQGERHEVDWTTQYTLEGARDHGWRECRVVDVSREGIGLLLAGTTPDALSAHRVIVAVDVPRATLRLRAQVRDVHALEGDGVRVGLEFVAMSVFERDMFDSFLATSPLASSAA